MLQTTVLSQAGRPAADVSALIVAHGHDSNSSHALTLKVYYSFWGGYNFHL